MTQTKIGIFTPAPLEFFGGGEIFVIKLANLLISKGYEVSVISNAISHVSPRVTESTTRKLLNCENARKTFAYNTASRYLKYWFQPLPQKDLLTSNNINLILVYRPPPKKYLKSLGHLNFRAVFMFHGITIEQLSGSGMRVKAFEEMVKLRLEHLKSCFAGQNSFCQVLNGPTYNFLLNTGFRKQNVFLIPFSIDFNPYKVQRNDKTFQIAFIGRMNRHQKGLDLLVNVVNSISSRRYTDVTFIILGSGPDERIVEKLSERFEKVNFRGYVSESEKIDYLSTSNLMIATSNIDPFPASIQEGLACGLPVVSTNVSGAMDMLSRNPSLGRLSSHSVNEFVSHVMEYYANWANDKEDYFKRKQIRRENATNLFDMSSMMNNYVEMIETIKS